MNDDDDDDECDFKFCVFSFKFSPPNKQTNKQSRHKNKRRTSLMMHVKKKSKILPCNK